MGVSRLYRARAGHHLTLLPKCLGAFVRVFPHAAWGRDGVRGHGIDDRVSKHQYGLSRLDHPRKWDQFRDHFFGTLSRGTRGQSGRHHRSRADPRNRAYGETDLGRGIGSRDRVWQPGSHDLSRLSPVRRSRRRGNDSVLGGDLQLLPCADSPGRTSPATSLETHHDRKRPTGDRI